MNQPAFWADNFDADLLKVVPGVVDLLGESAEIPLWTYNESIEPGGRINSPVAWNTRLGLAAFCWTKEPRHERDQYGWLRFGPANYSTKAPLIETTWLDILRDEWVHDSAVYVDQIVLLPERVFHGWCYDLMFDLRGQKVLTEAKRKQTQAEVRVKIRDATDQLRTIREMGRHG